MFPQDLLQHEDTSLIASYKWPADSAVSANLHRWPDWKFGVIIHWGPYSEWGVVESWITLGDNW
jgi:hypothetical protein